MSEKISGKIFGWSLFGVLGIGVIAILAMTAYNFLRVKLSTAAAPPAPPAQ